MVITLGMNLVYPHRVGSDDPLVAEVLTRTDSVSKISAHFTLQLAHHLFPVVYLASTVQPRHSLAFTIKFALPLLERSVFGTSLFGVASFILLHVISL